MKRPGANESREAIFQLAADEAAAREASKPRESEKHAARMLVDGFGSDTKQPAPYMRELHSAFVRAREGGRTPTALARTPVNSAAERGMTRSSRRFYIHK